MTFGFLKSNLSDKYKNRFILNLDKYFNSIPIFEELQLHKYISKIPCCFVFHVLHYVN